MRAVESIGLPLLLAALAACAARPAYFGADARLLNENGAAYWDAPARSASYLDVRMRRPRRASASEPTVYAGTMKLESIAPAVLRSSFTLAEGSSASFHYELDPRGRARSGPPLRYEPGVLDVVVSCAFGTCRADSRLAPIAPDGTVAVKTVKRRKARAATRAARKRAVSSAARMTADAPAARRTADTAASAAADSLRMDGECAPLHDGLKALRDRAERTGADETSAEQRLRDKYSAEGCAAWLAGHGGIGAAWRRIRVSQWTSIRGD